MLLGRFDIDRIIAVYNFNFGDVILLSNSEYGTKKQHMEFFRFVYLLTVKSPINAHEEAKERSLLALVTGVFCAA